MARTAQAARSLGLSLVVQQVQDPNAFESAFSSITKERAEALVVLADLRFNQHLERLVGLAAARRLPATYVSRKQTRTPDGDHTPPAPKAASGCDTIPG